MGTRVTGEESKRTAMNGEVLDAEDFEAVFLNSMFSQMMTKVDGEGPFGGSQAGGVWRSFLTTEYSKSFAKAGGIGLAKHVYGALLSQQEARAK